MKRRNGGVIILALLPVMIAVGGASCKKKGEKMTPQPPVKVEIMQVGYLSDEETRTYSGTVSSAETATVSFRVGGTITELPVKEGQKVSKGQLLGKVRNGDYLNAYNIANAQLNEAQDAYNRLKKLHDANALPDIKWVEIQQKLEQAKNAAEMARRALDDASLHAPVSGIVTRRFADVGQTILPVEPIYEIVSTTDFTIDVPVSENEVGTFEIGRRALVNLEASDIGSLEGQVTQKTVVADPLTRAFTVKVAIPNKDGKVLPGMTGTVKFIPSSSETASLKVITLPSQAVLLDSDNRLFVWVVEDSVARRRFVTADELVADGVEILSGLDKGDKVIVAGMQKVGTGTKVIPQLSRSLNDSGQPVSVNMED